MNPSKPKRELELKIAPVTKARWSGLVKLFGERGACGGCWCMYLRVTPKEFERQKGDGNKAAMKRLIDSGKVPGLLAYDGGEPIAWCAVGPREAFPRLENSRSLKRVDDQPVWSIVCLFIARPYRKQGISTGLIKAAVDYAHSQGATIVEGYPTDPGEKNWADVFVYRGLPSAYLNAGFTEVLRRSPGSPVMRINIKDKETR